MAVSERPTRARLDEGRLEHLGLDAAQRAQGALPEEPTHREQQPPEPGQWADWPDAEQRAHQELPAVEVQPEQPQPPLEQRQAYLDAGRA